MPPALSYAFEGRWAVDRGTCSAGCGAAAMRLAIQAGVGERTAWAVGIVVGELADNIAKYAGSGQVAIAWVAEPRPGVEIVAEDHGPGFVDPDVVFADGYSEGRFLNPEEDPRRRRGRGVGLGAVRRLMDEVSVANVAPRGARVVARKWLTSRAR